MIILPVTLTISAACALVHIWLAARCVRGRFQYQVSLGDGDNKAMRNLVRTHANFTENAPFFLILLGLCELAKGTNMWLWAAGIVFMLARIAHVFGMPRRSPNALRGGGMLISWAAMVALAIYAITLTYMVPMASTITDLPAGG